MLLKNINSHYWYKKYLPVAVYLQGLLVLASYKGQY